MQRQATRAGANLRLNVGAHVNCNRALAGGYLHDKQVCLHNKSEGVLPYECWKTKDCTVGEYIASLHSEHEFLPRRRPARSH